MQADQLDQVSVRAALTALPNGAVVVDSDLKLLFANAQALKLADKPDLSKPSAELTTVFPDLFCRSFRDFAASGLSTKEDQFRSEQGRYYQLVLSRVSGSQVVIGLLYDVTSLREQPEELRRMKERLQELDRQRSEFLGMAAHDLRSPLHKISLSAELLAGGSLPPEKRQKFLGIILRSAETMLQLLNDLLNITKIESGKLEIARQKINLRSYLETIVEDNRDVAMQSGITLALQVEDQTAEALIDPVRVEQVLTNLLSNAFKFSETGTTVSLRARKQESNTIIEVQDQGIGIPESEQSTIFTAFTERANKPLHGEGSTGLGLAICKRIVELHNGSIEVESVVGEGALFRVILPG